MELLGKPRIALSVLITCQIILIPVVLGTDVPFRDEWDSIIKSLVLRETSGFQFAQLLLPVVEHRLPLPMAVFHGLSLPRYYPKLLMLITAFVHALGWAVFWRSWAKDAVAKTYHQYAALTFLCAAMYFHLAQITNYTMGVQLFWMLGPMGTLVFISALLTKNWKLAAAGHLVACFSFPTWPIHLLLFLGAILLDRWPFRKSKVTAFEWITGSVVLLVGIITLGFLYGKDGPGFQIDPIKYLKFVIYVIASPFSRYKEALAWIFGPLFLILWTLGLYRGTRAVAREPFFLYGLLTVGSSLLIAYGRHNYDLSYAFGGHYLLLTAPGWCIVLFETLARIESGKKAQLTIIFCTFYVLGMGARSAYKDLKKSLPLKRQARECIAEAKERSEECREAMEFIFLNGFDEKYLLVKQARELGIYP